MFQKLLLIGLAINEVVELLIKRAFRSVSHLLRFEVRGLLNRLSKASRDVLAIGVNSEVLAFEFSNKGVVLASSISHGEFKGASLSCCEEQSTGDE